MWLTCAEYNMLFVMNDVSVSAADDDDATSHLAVKMSQTCSSNAESFDCKPPAWASQLRVT